MPDEQLILGSGIDMYGKHFEFSQPVEGDVSVGISSWLSTYLHRCFLVNTKVIFLVTANISQLMQLAVTKKVLGQVD